MFNSVTVVPINDVCDHLKIFAGNFIKNSENCKKLLKNYKEISVKFWNNFDEIRKKF